MRPLQQEKPYHNLRFNWSILNSMKTTSRPKSIEAYIARAPREVRGKLKELRAAIRKTAPKALEKISYGMPYYGYKGRLAYFAYFKDHLSLFAMPPIPEAYK